MINVSNIEDLYLAVNDPANVGETIGMAPGKYVLTAKDPDERDRLNGGRLDLLKDMSLIGVVGDRDAVKIDSSQLPVTSLRVPFSPPVPSPNRTGPIRMGLGRNTVEWLTVIGNPDAAGGIDTDLGDTNPAQSRVAHVVSGGSLRGLHVRNVGSAMAGRKLEAEIEDNDFSSVVGPLAGNPPRQAMGFENFAAASGEIYARMSGNRFHGSIFGCMLLNNKTNSGLIRVESNGDIYENNSDSGCWLCGQFAGSLGTESLRGGTVKFAAQNGKFRGNGAYGILAEGAEVRSVTNVAFDNIVSVDLIDCAAANNALGNFKAFGARAIPPVGIAGTNNVVTIERDHVSTQIVVDATDSEPPEPAGTNKVTVASSIYYRDFRPREITDVSGAVAWFTGTEKNSAVERWENLGTLDSDGIVLATSARVPADGNTVLGRSAFLSNGGVLFRPIDLPDRFQLRATFCGLRLSRTIAGTTSAAPMGGEAGDAFEAGIVMVSGFVDSEGPGFEHVIFNMQTTDKDAVSRGVRMFVKGPNSSAPDQGDFVDQSAFDDLYSDVSDAPIFTLNFVVNKDASLDSTAYLEVLGHRYDMARPYTMPARFFDSGLLDIRALISTSHGDGLGASARLYEFEILELK